MKKLAKCFFLFFLASAFAFEYPQPIPGYYSQKGQDKFLNETLFKGKKEGVFIEMGAHDGVSFSNTYFFETLNHWSGVCIEPNPDIFEQLLRNRKCSCEKACIASHSEQKFFLKCSGYITEMYSGIVDYYDPRHLARIDNEIAVYGGHKEVIEVNCVTCDDLFKKYNLEHIDLFCLDIEGGEEEIIKSIDFEKYKINVIVVENNFNEDRVYSYLLSKGYHYITRIGKDDIYQHQDFCE